MYLWNTKALITDLRNDQVTQKEQLKYFLFSTIPLYAMPQLETYYTVVNIVLILIGTLLCYNSNVEGDNKDFIVRYICLSIPIGIRIFLPMIIFAVLLTALLCKMSPNLSVDLAWTISCLILNIPYFYFLRSSIIQVSKVHDQTISA